MCLAIQQSLFHQLFFFFPPAFNNTLSLVVEECGLISLNLKFSPPCLNNCCHGLQGKWKESRAQEALPTQSALIETVPQSEIIISFLNYTLIIVFLCSAPTCSFSSPSITVPTTYSYLTLNLKFFSPVILATF